MLQNLRHQVQGRLTAVGLVQRWAGPCAFAAAIGVTYFLAARLSLALLTEPDGVAVFWPAAGIAAGILIALGRNARLPVVVGVMVATVAANMLGDRSLLFAFAKALCNAGEALLTAWLIEWHFGPSFNLNSLRRVLGLLVAASVGAAVSGIGGTIAFKLLHGSTAPAIRTWYHWFASDGLGIVTVAPLVIGLAESVRVPLPRSDLIEGVVALGALAAMNAFVISLPPEPWATAVPAALIFPLLLWLASRCRPVFAAAASFIIAVTVVWTTTFGVGLFGGSNLPFGDRIFAAQASMLAAALCALVLAALFDQQRQNECALSDGMKRLQEALTAGSVMTFEWDTRGRSSRRSMNAGQILGFDPLEPMTPAHFLSQVHPADHAKFKAHIHSVRPENPSYDASFRFIRPDGRQVWLEETAHAEFDAAGRCLGLKGLTRDISRSKQAEEHQRLLIAELDHRAKNVLSRVAAVAMSTRQGAGSMDDFVLALDKRIQSMAHAHALLSQSRWQGGSLAELVRHELAPYATTTNTRIYGPDVVLRPAATEAVAMVLHELVTNAAKYGALSTPHGRVSINWEQNLSSNLAATIKIEWREIGGPRVAAPSNSGYGTSAIRNLIPHELGGAVELLFEPTGVRCRIDIPLEQAQPTASAKLSSCTQMSRR
jgi:PAS domain S-box-containing protein